MAKPTFARILRHAREHAGLSIRDLATAAKLSPQSISNLESGELRNGKRVTVKPSLETVAALAKALGLPLDTFLDALLGRSAHA